MGSEKTVHGDDGVEMTTDQNADLSANNQDLDQDRTTVFPGVIPKQQQRSAPKIQESRDVPAAASGLVPGVKVEQDYEHAESQESGTSVPGVV